MSLLILNIAIVLTLAIVLFSILERSTKFMTLRLPIVIITSLLALASLGYVRESLVPTIFPMQSATCTEQACFESTRTRGFPFESIRETERNGKTVYNDPSSMAARGFGGTALNFTFYSLITLGIFYLIRLSKP